MKKYKLLKSWLDLQNNKLHEKVGEILEIEDEARAEYLIGLEIIEEVSDKPEAVADDKKADTKRGSKK